MHIQCVDIISFVTIFVYSFLLQINALFTSILVRKKVWRQLRFQATYRSLINSMLLKSTLVGNSSNNTSDYSICMICADRFLFVTRIMQKMTYNWVGKVQIGKKLGKSKIGKTRHGLSYHFLYSIFICHQLLRSSVYCVVAFHQMPNNIAAALVFGRMPIEWRRWFTIHQNGRKTYRPKNAEEPKKTWIETIIIMKRKKKNMEEPFDGKKRIKKEVDAEKRRGATKWASIKNSDPTNGMEWDSKRRNMHMNAAERYGKIHLMMAAKKCKTNISN